MASGAGDRHTAPGTHHVVGRGSDMAIEVSGATAEACLAAAVEGFAAAVGEVNDSAVRRRVRVEVDGDAPAEVLVGLLDEAILLLDADGVLAVGLHEPRLGRDGLRGELDVVDLHDVRVTGPSPKAATWHDARLEPSGNGWRGAVMLDL